MTSECSLHLADEETKAQKGLIACPKSGSRVMPFKVSTLQLLEHVINAQPLGILAMLSPVITGYTYVLLGFPNYKMKGLSL